MKRLENMRHLLGRKTGTGVADLDQGEPRAGAYRGEAYRRRPLAACALTLQGLRRVPAEVLDDSLDVVGIGEKLEFRRNVDGVADRRDARSLGGLDDLAHDFPQIEGAPRRGLFARCA